MDCQPNGLIEVELMEGNWDGMILRKYNRYVLSWRPKGFSGEESRSSTLVAEYGALLGDFKE